MRQRGTGNNVEALWIAPDLLLAPLCAADTGWITKLGGTVERDSAAGLWR